LWAGAFVQHVVYKCLLMLLTLKSVEVKEELIENVQIKPETFVKNKCA